MTKPTFIKKLKELFIRFNTSPKLYQKSDFYLLLQLIGGLFENSDESLLGEDGKIEEKYLPTIPTENKEYFPDYAFWQKPGAKKGAQVLIAPKKTDNFGYTKKYIDFLLEVGRATGVQVEEVIETQRVDKEEYDEETDDIIQYSVDEEINRISTLTGNSNLKTFINRAKYLLSQKIVAEDDTLLLKFGALNAIHDRSGYIEPVSSSEEESDSNEELADINSEPDPFSITLSIHNNDYQGLKQTTIKRQIDTPVRFSELDFYVPISDIIRWSDEEEIQIVVTGKENDLGIKFKNLTTLNIFTDVDSYYLPMQNSFYALEYFQKDDEWKLSKIEEKTVKVKYHKTEATLSNVILRNTYREYREPSFIVNSGGKHAGIYVDDIFYFKKDFGQVDGTLYKRFVHKSSIVGRRTGTTRYKNFRFIETWNANKGTLSFQHHTILRGHEDAYVIVGRPASKFMLKRESKPCNKYRFILRKGNRYPIGWHRRGKIHRYAYFAKIPLFRISNLWRIKFIGFLTPKIVY